MPETLSISARRRHTTRYAQVRHTHNKNKNKKTQKAKKEKKRRIDIYINHHTQSTEL